MSELEKVIKGLECCSQSDNYSRKPCKECPYNHEWRDDQGIVHLCKITQLRKDALFLLKAQGPRVMTLEDVKQAEVGTVVWLEWRIESKLNSAIFFRLINKDIDDSLEFHVLDCFVAARLACYGTEWRCWTSRPTDKQREATPWAEPPKEET